MDYIKLTNDLIKAKQAAIEAAKGEDGGSANLDTVTIQLPRARENRVEQAASEAGLSVNKIDWFGIRYFIYPPSCGQGNARVRATRAMQKVLNEAGYGTLMYSQLD